MYKAALFDLDGTLLDTAPDLALAANALRVELGMPLLREDVIASFVGKGMENLVRRVLAGSLDAGATAGEPIDGPLASFKRHYHRVNGDRSRIFDGVLEGLRTMREAGLALGVVTNKPEEFTLPLLEQTGLRRLFAVVVGGDTCARKKPDPLPIVHACEVLGVRPEEAVMIGDSMNDTIAGRAARTAVLVVPYGYNEGMDVASLDADAIVRDMPAAAAWIAARNAG